MDVVLTEYNTRIITKVNIFTSVKMDGWQTDQYTHIQIDGQTDIDMQTDGDRHIKPFTLRDGGTEPVGAACENQTFSATRSSQIQDSRTKCCHQRNEKKIEFATLCFGTTSTDCHRKVTALVPRFQSKYRLRLQ